MPNLDAALKTTREEMDADVFIPALFERSCWPSPTAAASSFVGTGSV